MATTTTYGLNKPTVGGDENTWGGLTNDNWDDVDDLLDGTTPITPNLGAGWEVGGVAVTATAAELNILDGVTASTAELNILDGVTWTLTDYNTLTVTAAELNILDGATVTTAELNALDGVTATGTALIVAADEAAGRAAIDAPALPTSSAGAGNFVSINPAVDAAAVLPAGGNWAYAIYRFNSGVVASSAFGVAAGGTTIGGAASGQNWSGFAWRVE
jgi:hypothetical protein